MVPVIAGKSGSPLVLRPDVKRERSGVGLTVGHEELRKLRVSGAAVGGVGHEADDGQIEGAVASKRHALADGVPAQPELPGKRLVDDGHRRHRPAVSTRELAAGHQRNAKRGEVARADPRVLRRHVGVHIYRKAFDRHRVAGEVVGEQRNRRGRHRDDTRQRGKSILELPEERPGARRGIAVQLRCHGKGHQALAPDAEIHACHVCQAGDEEAGLRQQRRCQRHLRHRQGASRARRRPRGGGVVRQRNQLRRWARPDRLHGGKDAEEQPGAQPERAGEQEERQVEGGVDGHPTVHRQQGERAVNRQADDDQCHRGASDAEQTGLGQEPLQHPAAWTPRATAAAPLLRLDRWRARAGGWRRWHRR